MPTNWTRSLGLIVLATALIPLSPCGALGQQVLVTRQAQSQPVVVARQPGRANSVLVASDELRADDTRNALREVLRIYPPSLGRVLRLDPSLMNNAAYLASYPALAQFLQQHPEIARSPEYFLSFIDASGAPPREINPEMELRMRSLSMLGDFGIGIVIATGFVTAGLTLAWIIRFIVGHRRWLRATRTQSEVHNRLLERFSSNEDLLAYVQSPAGRHFLQSVPVATETTVATASPVAAPFTRIFWAVQAGVVLACAGAGMLYIRRYLMEEASQILLVFGTLAVSLGVGFALASVASYALSARLGLLAQTKGTARDSAGV